MRERHRWGYPAAIFAKLVSLLSAWLNIRIYAIYAGELKSKHTRSDTTSGKYAYHLYDSNNYHELIHHTANGALELDAQFIEKAIAKGDICVCVFAGDKLISYEWSAFSPTEDAEGIFATFPKGYRYGYKSFTLPSYRGRHLRDGAMALRDEYSISKGCSKVIFFISVANHASIRAVKRLGRARVGYAVYFAYKDIFLRFHSRGCKKTGFEFRKLADTR